MLATITVLALANGAGTPDTPEQPTTRFETECTSGEAESVFLPGGGEVETIKIGSAVRVTFYLDGERVLTVSEKDGRVDTDVTEYGLALEPERATELRDEVVSHVEMILAGPEECGALYSRADEDAKCGLLGIGAGTLGALGGAAVGGVIGSLIGGAAGYSLGTLCTWLVAKVCEENSEGC